MMQKKGFDNVIMPPSNLILPEWHPGDGPTEWVFNKLPKGHRCAWSVTWLVKNPENPRQAIRIGPNSWKHSSPDLMSDLQLLAELADKKTTNRALEVFRLLDSHPDTAEVVWRKDAERLVRELREHTPEYIAVAGAPGKEAFTIPSAGGAITLTPAQRPGWIEIYESQQGEKQP